MFTIMFAVCDCLLDGSMTVSANSTLTPCDMVTGQCVCLVPGITGLRCDSCLPATNCESLSVTDTIQVLAVMLSERVIVAHVVAWSS